MNKCDLELQRAAGQVDRPGQINCVIVAGKGTIVLLLKDWVLLLKDRKDSAFSHLVKCRNNWHLVIEMAIGLRRDSVLEPAHDPIAQGHCFVEVAERRVRQFFAAPP